MKVGISYTAELDEVPREISRILKDIESFVPTTFDELVGDVISENFNAAYNNIAKIRKDILKIDSRLEDCHNIINGYLDIREQLASEANKDQPVIEKYSMSDIEGTLLRNVLESDDEVSG